MSDNLFITCLLAGAILAWTAYCAVKAFRRARGGCHCCSQSCKGCRGCAKK